MPCHGPVWPCRPASWVRSAVLIPAAWRAVASSASAVASAPWPPQRVTAASNIARVPDVARPQVVGLGRGDGRDGLARRRQRRRQRVVEREALQRVVVGAVPVEVAAEPADAAGRVDGADLPVVARGEVRLVGVAVADRRDHAQLPGGVQVAQRRGGRMPAQAAVLGERERGVGAQRERAAQRRVAGVADGRQQRQRVQAAGAEDRDEHAVLAGGLGGRDPGVERLRAQRGAAEHGQREPARARQERAPRQPGAGGQRHAGLDRAQAAAGGRGAAAQQLGAGEARAAAGGGGGGVGHQLVW